MSSMLTEQEQFKALIKQALREVLFEQREELYNLVSEVVEDIGLLKAMQEGESSEPISRDEVFALFKDEE